MRHSLATIGGMTLRPGDLLSEISLSGIGLRNAAALFLPEEGSFTKAVAEDLEAIREWPKDMVFLPILPLRQLFPTAHPISAATTRPARCSPASVAY